LIEEFALTYLKSGLAAWGVMYLDGHFLPYYGMHAISKGWHGVRQMPMKGSYNFLAVDERFAPWLFLVRASTEDLLQKVPELIEQTKRIGAQAGVGQQRLNQLIVVFDREGYSAELYRYLEGKDQGAGKRRAMFISWAKYSDKWVNDKGEVPDWDFVLRWKETNAEIITPRAWIQEVGDETYALMEIRAPKASGLPVPMDFYFLVDTSGSIRGAIWQNAALSVQTSVSKLASEDRVMLTFFNDHTRDFAAEPFSPAQILKDANFQRLE
jgi:hypothetical protein